MKAEIIDHENYKITIKDTGVGIEHKDLENIFIAFKKV